MKNYSLKTKENFYRNSKYAGLKRLVLWIVVLVCALVFLRDVIAQGTALFAHSVYAVRHYMLTSTATIPVFLQSRLELLDRIKTLETRVASSRGMENTLAYLTKENEELRSLLSASSTPRTVAGVIARPPYTPYDTIIIDRGSNDGIIQNAPVYHGNNIVIGYVRNVFPDTAHVTLLSSAGTEATVYLFGSQLFTTAYGEGGGIVRLSVPQGVPITHGDTVILPGLEGGVLGTVRDIQSIPTEPEQHAYVALPVSLQSIRLVGVGTRSVSPSSLPEAEARVEESARTLFKIDVPSDDRVFIPTRGTSTSSEEDVSSSTPSTTP